jgi:hypothetical protein
MHLYVLLCMIKGTVNHFAQHGGFISGTYVPLKLTAEAYKGALRNNITMMLQMVHTIKQTADKTKSIKH